MSVIKNFFVLHKSGKTVFSQNCHGEILDQSLIIGFSSSVSNFSRTLLSDDIREVVALKGRVVYKQIGNFLFVAHADFATSSAIVQAILRDLTCTLEFLFGKHDEWDDEFFDLEGCHDIISAYLTQGPKDPSVIVGGITEINLEEEVRDRIDRLLMHFENGDGICGNGTMLILGDAILHSRFELAESRMILQYTKVRPLKTSIVSYTPVYCNKAWFNLYRVRVQNYVMAVLTYLDRPFSHISRRIEDFRVSLAYSRLELPTEEPPVLLRLYAKRDTLAVLYHNVKTGKTMFPQSRAGPDIQQKEMMNMFWWFCGDACSSLKIPGVTEYSMTRDLYRFYARSEGIHKLYILCSAEQVSTETMSSVATDVLKNILTR